MGGKGEVFILLLFFLTFRIFQRQRKDELGAFAYFAFNPDRSPMSLYRHAAERKSNAQTGGPAFYPGFKSCEFFKDAFML